MVTTLLASWTATMGPYIPVRNNNSGILVDFVLIDLFLGDLIILQPSSLRFIAHWPDLLQELDQDRVEAPVFYRKHTGELILGPTTPTYNDPEFLAEREGDPFAAPVQIRVKFYRMLLRQVAKVGLKVTYNQQVVRYFEKEDAGLGGVVTKQGLIHLAHLVIAADAFRSASELLIAGEQMPTRSSGMSVYRTAYPTQLALKQEAFRELWGDAVKPGGQGAKEYWLGPGMHLGLFVSPDVTAWGFTPRDQFLLPGGEDPVESWDADVEPESVIKVLEKVPDWSPAAAAIIRATPKGTVVHWPLLWRNLRPEWTSRGARVVQVGDCAHSNVPTSVSGGTMAIEDAVTLAACLRISCSAGAGQNAPLGARIYNLLRYQRVSCAQKMAFVNSQLLAATDWASVERDPLQVRLRFPRWVFQHDPERYVYEKYGQAFAHLDQGTPFENTNFPPGHKFEAWTIEQIHKDIAAGKSAVNLLDGDWS
jgi:2-polyprenyl-6-methoxyphenol hydroxylase-like FAD-dependent oxidoreductase